MPVNFTDSAGKHGFTVEQAVYAVENAVYAEREFADPRPPATVRPWLFSVR